MLKKLYMQHPPLAMDCQKNFPTKETDNIDTRYPYSFSKNIGEQVIQHWSKVYDIEYISLRLFNVYGTRSRTHGAYGAALGVF